METETAFQLDTTEVPCRVVVFTPALFRHIVTWNWNFNGPIALPFICFGVFICVYQNCGCYRVIVPWGQVKSCHVSSLSFALRFASNLVLQDIMQCNRASGQLVRYRSNESNNLLVSTA